MSAIDFAARIVGVPQETIDAVEKAAPSVAALLQMFKDHEDFVVQASALLTQATAFWTKVQPLVGPAMKEINAIMPAAQDVIAFVQKQSAAMDQPPEMRT